MTTQKRVSAVMLLAVLLLAPVLALLKGFSDLPVPTWREITGGTYAAQAEGWFRANFPGQDWLTDQAWNLRYRTGTKEIDGYFITDAGSIIKNVGEPDEALVEDNGGYILGFAERTGMPTYLMLIPTASAIKQQDLPEFATPTLYNQKEFIEQVYREFAGAVTTVNVYPTLFSNQTKRLYYNTEDMVTPLGGYYIYTVLGAKLGVTVRSMDQFSVEYALHDYRGPLAAQFPYARVKPDILTLYHYNYKTFTRTYEIRHTTPEGMAFYRELYPKAMLETAHPLDVYLGGMSQVVEMNMGESAVSSSKLLIVGDETAQSYLPFLALDYEEICFVNANTATEEQMREVDVLKYDQVLFAFSTDTYMHGENLEILAGV